MQEEQSAPYLIDVLKRLPDDIPLFLSCHMWQEETRVIFHVVILLEFNL